MYSILTAVGTCVCHRGLSNGSLKSDKKSSFKSMLEELKSLYITCQPNIPQIPLNFS